MEGLSQVHQAGEAVSGAVVPPLSGPVRVGDYARSAFLVVDGGSERPLLPEGAVARWDTSAAMWMSSGQSWGSEFDRYALPPDGGWSLLVPQSVDCPRDFSAWSDRGAWGRRLPPEAAVDGFRAAATAMLDRTPVRLLDVWGDTARVSTDERDALGDWVDLSRLTRVVVEQTRALTATNGELTASVPDRFMDWRVVLPQGFNGLGAPGAAPEAPLAGWTPSYVGPVPASGQMFAVLGGVPFKAAEFHDRDHVYPEPVTLLKADPYYPRPQGFGVDRNYSKWWMTRPIATSQLDGTFSVARVRAIWRGRHVEVRHVAYAYAYVRDLETVPGRQRPVRQPGLAELDSMEGPIRLDELQHVRFSVSVKTRHRDGGPWRFLEAWGLNPYLRTWAAVHIERGAWQSWPVPAAGAAGAAGAAPSAAPTRTAPTAAAVPTTTAPTAPTRTAAAAPTRRSRRSHRSQHTGA